MMYTKNVETIEPFSSQVIPVSAGRAYMEKHIYVDGTSLADSGRFFATGPHGAEHVH